MMDTVVSTVMMMSTIVGAVMVIGHLVSVIVMINILPTNGLNFSTVRLVMVFMMVRIIFGSFRRQCNSNRGQSAPLVYRGSNSSDSLFVMMVVMVVGLADLWSRSNQIRYWRGLSYIISGRLEQ